MNKEEYYKRLEKTTEKIKTDRCSEDDIANINRQKLYLAEHYISNLEQENQRYKEIIDNATDKCNKTLDYINNTLLKNNVKVELTELLEIKGGLDIILESLVEDQLKRWNK